MIKTEGVVSLSINELDNLRTTIDNLSKERDDLLLHQKEVKVNLLVEESFNDFREVSCYSSYNRYSSRYGSVFEYFKNKRTLQETINYIHFDEVKQELKREAQEKVRTELESKNLEINRLNSSIISLKDSNNKNIDELKSKIHQLEHPEILTNSAEQIIIKLKAQIEILKKRSFWDYLFGTKYIYD